MKRPQGAEIKNYELPTGYTFCFYKNGYEMDWAEIETSVLEFDDQDSALQYYNGEFMSYIDELQRRQIFVRDPKGKLVTTVTSWWTETTERRIAMLHWVAVKPEHQGKGLGKAIVSEGIRRMVVLDGDVDIYLHTQTWSYKAINIYLDTGF